MANATAERTGTLTFNVWREGRQWDESEAPIEEARNAGTRPSPDINDPEDETLWEAQLTIEDLVAIAEREEMLTIYPAGDLYPHPQLALG